MAKVNAQKPVTANINIKVSIDLKLQFMGHNFTLRFT